MIGLDLCQPHYQNLFIISLKFIPKRDSVEIKTANLNVNLKDLKITNFFIIAKECRKEQLKPIYGLIKKFSNTCKFCTIDINKFILLLKKEFIHMNIWIVGKDLMKLHFQIKSFYS